MSQGKGSKRDDKYFTKLYPKEDNNCSYALTLPVPAGPITYTKVTSIQRSEQLKARALA